MWLLKIWAEPGCRLPSRRSACSRSNGSRRLRPHRGARRERGRLQLAIRVGTRHRVIGRARTGRHAERGGQIVRGRRNDLGVAFGVAAVTALAPEWHNQHRAGHGGIGEVQIELVVAVATRHLTLLERIVETTRGSARLVSAPTSVRVAPATGARGHGIVDHAVRIDRQIEVQQIVARLHDDGADRPAAR